MLRKYVTDPSIKSMMGTATGVRFTGKIIDKLDDGKTIAMQIEMPDHDGYVRATVKLNLSRYGRVSLFDTITGVGDLNRTYVGEKAVMDFSPTLFAVRNSNGRQVA